MTEQGKRRATPSKGRWGFCLGSIFLLLLILRNAEVASRLCAEGLRLCATAVIPSLFPFMVASEMIVSGGVGRLLGNLFYRPAHLLFGVSREGSAAALLGLLCGFPVGARCALSLYRQGRITRWELSHLLTFSSTPSFGFLVGSVGVSLFGSHDFGLKLCAVTLLSAVLTGFAGKILHKNQHAEADTPPISTPLPPKGSSLFTDAVASSALAMLKICAFVVFFSAFVGTLEYCLIPKELNPAVESLCFGFFEMTGGILRAAKCDPAISPYLCAALAGWSGWSVHFQLISLSDEGISHLPYLLAKAAQGLLSPILLTLWNLLT